MAQKGNLREFLEAHKSDGNWTHTSLAGGKYFIPEDDRGRFYDLYVESLLDQEKQHLVEKVSDIGPLRIDFDFIYNREIDQHQHTREQVSTFCKAYIAEIGQYLVLPDEFDIWIMEKRKPTLDAKKNRSKSGIHIVVPSICTHKFVEQRTRRNLLKVVDDIFKGLPLQEPWDKVYDEGVVNRSVPWTLYGSRKNDPNSLPYLCSYIIRNRGGETSIESPPPLTSQLIKDLSLVRSDDVASPLTDLGKEIYGNLSKSQGQEPKISGGRSVTPSRGRLAHRSDKPSSRESSPSNRIVLQPLDLEKKRSLKDHTMNLSTDRYTDYSKWVEVAICLHNIHPDLLDTFLDFSAQYEKYNEAECITKWNSIKFRTDGDRSGEGSLRFWSREDNFVEYVEIEKRNIGRLVEKACSGTEHDVACVIHAKFRDAYTCCDFGKNVWYRWAGHVWRETDHGIDLQLKLSREIAGVFFNKMTGLQSEMSNRGLINCSGEGKTDCGSCEYCQCEIQRSGLNKVYTKLKTTVFKNNIMRECRELFFDEEFTKKLDSNKDLLACNNGVIDLVDMSFRDGKPNDYLSFSTGIDFNPEKSYKEYDTWPVVETFIHQVLPDEEVREYFLRHLATNLVGGNPAQKFHIMTGSGSNGKSMIMNLTSTSLGDYACTVPISLFTQQRKGSGNAAPEVIRLKGRRFVTMQEPDESIALNTGLMKEITSGEKMYARDLFKSGTEFEVQAKFHLACNDKPKINTTDGGTWRRLVVINFVSKFVQYPTGKNEYPLDESIQYLVQSHEWAAPFFAYLVHILKTGVGLRKLVAPPKVLEYTSDYRNDNDGIAKFISEKLVVEEGVPVEKPILKRLFKTWKDENDLRDLKPIDMERRVETMFGKYPKGGWTSFRID